MKGTIFDFLKLASEKPQLASELVALAGKYDFEFSDEVSDEELDGVAGTGLGLSMVSLLESRGLGSKDESSRKSGRGVHSLISCRWRGFARVRRKKTAEAGFEPARVRTIPLSLIYALPGQPCPGLSPRWGEREGGRSLLLL